jgi:PAS domain S-box-containing protein
MIMNSCPAEALRPDPTNSLIDQDQPARVSPPGDVAQGAREPYPGNEQALLAAIVNSSEDAIVSKNLQGIVTSWNKAAERIYGWTANEIIGQSKALVIPADLPDELPNILQRIRAGQRIQHYETRRVRKDGAIIDVAISVSPVQNLQGEIMGAATIVRDITESKRLLRELQLRQAEIEALNQRLTRAMQETHHRVKNNLQIVAAIIDMQLMEHAANRTLPLEELGRLGNHIQSLAVVHDLLTRQIGQNEHEQLLSSRAVLERLLELLKETSGSRSLRATIDEVDLLSKQAITLSLLLNELVSNAVKHTTGNVEVSFQVRGGWAQLSVCDDGGGFPEGFDPVMQAHTGLELALGLTRTDLNGDIFFENREGGGACVRVLFTLPHMEAIAGAGALAKENWTR